MKKNYSIVILLLFAVAMTNVVQAQKIWGVAQWGGANNGGTLYNMNPDGTSFTVVHDFLPPNGYTPQGTVMKASDGNIYGTCWNGGIYASCTIWRYNPVTDTYIDVWDFDITNGDFPESGLIEGPTSGVLYGVVPYGGAGSLGVIYSYTIATDVYSNLHNFTGTTGAYANSTPILLGTKLYGTTRSGGVGGTGVIYSYDIPTDVYTVEYNLNSVGCSSPFGSLIMANNGKMYGMTEYGGADNLGAIFSFDPVTHACVKLHDFDSTGGVYPRGNLMQSSGGLLYGVTSKGGLYNKGVIFSYSIAGNSYTKLFDFDGTTTGGNPQAELYQDAQGVLYGTAMAGGAGNNGTAFSFDPLSLFFTKTMDYTSATGVQPDGGFSTLQAAPNGVVENQGQFIRIYPNPATTTVTLTAFGNTGENTRFSIKNIAGQVVMSWTDNVSSAYTKTVNVEDLAAGMYTVEAANGNTVLVRKFIKE